MYVKGKKMIVKSRNENMWTFDAYKLFVRGEDQFVVTQSTQTDD